MVTLVVKKRQLSTEALEAFRGMFHAVYANDNLIALNRNLTFLKDEAFVKSFEKNVRTAQEKSLLWRIHTLAWAANHCLSVDGDYVECGVWHGFSMAVVADYINFATLQDRTMYLYDTFVGIPDDYNTENRSNAVYENEPDLYEKCVKRFSVYPNAKVVKGAVPASFEESSPEKIAFWHIDMNSSKSELEALEHLYDRVVPGGMIIFDDFGWSGYDRQAWAEIDFMKKRGHHVLEIPTGQGVVVKHA
jgi:O-methyltransferase